MSSGAKRSNPAATAVWVVKRFPARVTANALERQPGRLHEAARPFQDGERRMSFVEMTDFRLDSERREQPPAADAEHELLHEAQVGPPPYSSLVMPRCAG